MLPSHARGFGVWIMLTDPRFIQWLPDDKKNPLPTASTTVLKDHAVFLSGKELANVEPNLQIP